MTTTDHAPRIVQAVRILEADLASIIGWQEEDVALGRAPPSKMKIVSRQNAIGRVQ
jgi:hypothetical protein